MSSATFDPTQSSPDFQGQRDALSRLYQQGLIKLNAQKGSLMSSQGFLNTGNYGTNGQPVDFSNIQVDPNAQYGGYRNELTSEANMLDNAQNGPDRGFSGGLANQASRYAQQAVGARQTAYQQNLQQQFGNMNLAEGDLNFNYNEGVTGVNSNAAQYGASQALWQALNATAAPPTSVPGSSGGGSVPVGVSTKIASPINDTTGAKAAAAARSKATSSNVFGNLGHNT